MKLRSQGLWGAVAGLMLSGASAALAAGGASPLSAAAVGAGARVCALGLDLAHRLPLSLIVPVIAISLSFHAGSRMGRYVRRPAQARVATAGQSPAVRYAILMGLVAMATFILLAAQNGMSW